MKVLVTGANGFIGRHLVSHLIKEDHDVLNLPHELLTKFPDRLEEKLKNAQFDWIFALHAYGNMANQKDRYEILNANVAGIFNLLESMLQIPYKAFINVSSSSVELYHQTLYSATKMGGEYLARAYHDEFKKPIVNVRPFSVYGPGEADFRFIPTVFRSCLMGEKFNLVPNASHDWVYIDDVVSQMIYAAESIDELNGFNIQIGTGIDTTNRYIIERIEQITGKKSNYDIVESLRSFDNDSWHALGVNPGYTQLDEGLKKIYESIKKSK